MTVTAASDRSVLVRVEEHRDVFRLTRALVGVRGILNVHPAFCSVLVDFDPRLRLHEDVEGLVRECMESPHEEEPAETRTVEIPVWYGGDFGPDLGDVAEHAGISQERVIEMHLAAEYIVLFVGFSTCFPYLGGLPAELATPRLAAPRKHVPEGSVAIGGAQAGVYPLASPGGWRLIGRTPLRLFDPQGSPPALLRMGDRVRFVRMAGDRL